MAIATSLDFLEVLRQVPLLNPAQLDEIAETLAPQLPEALDLARELLTRGWLTAYQVNQLFQGKGAGLILGQYAILERIGEGGMGRVFKARHQALDRVVALKILNKEYLSRPDVVQRFFQEIQAAARLSHPNIVMAFDAGQVADTYYLVMEYVHGMSLSHLVGRVGPLPVHQACDYVRQAARGLQHAAGLGLIHRDLKPSNLLVTRLTPASPANDPGAAADVRQRPRGAQVKIIDFGLARLQSLDGPDGARRITRIGTVMGTPDYMAPEQATDTAKADTRSDLYSLGCTFYFLLAGQVPFPGGSALEKIRRHESKLPIPIERLNRAVPTGLGDLIRDLMAKRPDDRFQTPRQLAVALKPFLNRKVAAPLVLPTVDHNERVNNCSDFALGPIPGVADAVSSTFFPGGIA